MTDISGFSALSAFMGGEKAKNESYVGTPDPPPTTLVEDRRFTLCRGQTRNVMNPGFPRRETFIFKASYIFCTIAFQKDVPS